MQTRSNSSKGSSKGSPPHLPSGDASQAAGQWTVTEEAEFVDFLSKHIGDRTELGLFKKRAYTKASTHLTMTFGAKSYFTASKCAQKWNRVCLIMLCY